MYIYYLFKENVFEFNLKKTYKYLNRLKNFLNSSLKIYFLLNLIVEKKTVHKLIQLILKLYIHFKSINKISYFNSNL